MKVGNNKKCNSFDYSCYSNLQKSTLYLLSISEVVDRFARLPDVPAPHYFRNVILLCHTLGTTR